MPIYQSDLARLQPGADEAASQMDKMRALILGHQNTMQQAQQQQGLDIGKYAANKGTDVGAAKQKQAEEIQSVKDLMDSGKLNEGGSVKIGDVTAGKGFDPNKVAMAGNKAMQSEMGALDKAPASKDLAGIKGQLQNVNYMHDLLDDPNKMDEGTFMALKAQAALGGSGSRAIGQVMHALGGNDKSLSGSWEDFKNQITGSANTTRTAAQINAARDSAFKYQNELEGRYKDASAQLQAQAPQYAPSMAQSGVLQSQLAARMAPQENLLKGLNARKQAYTGQTKAAGVGNTLGQPAQPYAQPQGVVDKLSSFLRGSPAAAPQQPAAPAMSFEQFKAKKAAGQL